MRRIDGFVWPGLFLLTVLSVLFLAFNPEMLTGKKLYKSDQIEESQISVSNFAGANKVSAGSFIRQIAFKAHSHRSAEMAQNLIIYMRLISSEKKTVHRNSEKRHDQQFVKSSSGLCPGAYEHAL